MKRRGEGCGLDGDGFYPLDLGDEGAGEDGNGYGGGEGGYNTSGGDAGVWDSNEKRMLAPWTYVEEVDPVVLRYTYRLPNPLTFISFSVNLEEDA